MLYIGSLDFLTICSYKFSDLILPPLRHPASCSHVIFLKILFHINVRACNVYMSTMFSRFICVVVAGEISLCISLYACPCVCAHACGLCLCLCVVHVEAEVHVRCLFQSLCLLLFETGCLSESEADSTKESGQQVPGIILPLSPQHWGLGDALPCLASSVNWGNSQLKSSVFPASTSLPGLPCPPPISLRQGMYLSGYLELTIVDQAGLQLLDSPPASASWVFRV